MYFPDVFNDFLKSSENLWKSSKFSENFVNGSKLIFGCFYDFLKFSEIIGSVRKSSENFRS